MDRYNNHDDSCFHDYGAPRHYPHRRPRIIDPRELDKRSRISHNSSQEANKHHSRISCTSHDDQAHVSRGKNNRRMHMPSNDSRPQAKQGRYDTGSPSAYQNLQESHQSYYRSGPQMRQLHRDRSMHQGERLKEELSNYNDNMHAHSQQKPLEDLQNNHRPQNVRRTRRQGPGYSVSGYEHNSTRSRTPHLSDMDLSIERHRSKKRLTFLLCLVVIAVVVASSIGVALAITGNNQTVSSMSMGQSYTSHEAKVVVSDIPQRKSEFSAENQMNTSNIEELSSRDDSYKADPNNRNWTFKTNGHKTIYLTIDDGPSKNTQPVLDILDRYGAKATFFVVGFNDNYFPMIAEAYKRGHTIGLHSMTHDYASIYSSKQAFFNDLDAIGAIVAEQIGYVPAFIRFPGGSSNMISANYTQGIMTTLSTEVQDRGYQYYDWTISFGDGADHSADELVEYACQPPVDENIMMLLHDSTGKDTTVEALPRVIEYYQNLGYSFEAITRESWVCHHGVGN